MRSFLGLVLGFYGVFFNFLMSFLLFFFFFISKAGEFFLLGGVMDLFIYFASDIGIWAFFLACWFFLVGVAAIVCSLMLNVVDKAGPGGVGCVLLGILTFNLLLIAAGLMGIIAHNSNATIYVRKVGVIYK